MQNVTCRGGPLGYPESELFPLRNKDQQPHDANQPLLTRRFLIGPNVNMALVADCGNHIDPLPDPADH